MCWGPGRGGGREAGSFFARGDLERLQWRNRHRGASGPQVQVRLLIAGPPVAEGSFHRAPGVHSDQFALHDDRFANRRGVQYAGIRVGLP